MPGLWSEGELVRQLRRLGLRAGDRLVVHGSLRSIGHLAEGERTLIAALVDCIGASGLLVVPTFTSSSRFDPATDAGSTGRIAEGVRTAPGAVRSWHPTHSVAALGSGAAALCADHHRHGGTSRGSPLDRLASSGGKVLLIGVGHVRNSTIHVGESHAQASYLQIPFAADDATSALVATPGGEQEVALVEPPGCSRAFGAVERDLRARAAIRDGFVGDALAQLCEGSSVIDVTVAMLGADPAALLCTDPDCYRCAQARRAIAGDRT
jgi:aminoglycoside 3-N-acetyltransferase